MSDRNDSLAALIPQIIRTTTASISFLSSTVMAIALMLRMRQEGQRQSSPFFRIILCLSIADIIKSLAITIGPFAVPRHTPQALYAVGNTRSCEVQGFFINASGTIIPMYTFLLGIYFLMRVKYGMSREVFSKKIERYGHAIILIWNLICGVYAIFNGYINAATFGTTCTIISLPASCDADDCIRGKDAGKLLILTAGIPVMISHAGMLLSLFTLTYQVFADRKRTLTLTAIAYKKQMLIQSCLYTFGLIFTYSFGYVALFVSLVRPHPIPIWITIVYAITWPIGGLINILIYTRPKIIITRTRQPELSWTKAFYSVILAGAEVPDDCHDDVPAENLQTDEGRSIDVDIGDNSSRGSALKSFMNREELVPVCEVSSMPNPIESLPWSEQALQSSLSIEQHEESKHRTYLNYSNKRYT